MARLCHAFLSSGVIALFIFIASCGGGGSSSSTSSAETNSVSMGSGDVFSPSSLAVSAGDTVTWTNNTVTVHTVTSSDGLFDSGDVSYTGSYSYTFSEPGTYSYYCTYHGFSTGIGMAGTITVTAAN